MTQRENAAFTADGGLTLRGALYLPDGDGPHPAITMAQGFAGVRQQGILPFAEAFAAAGFVVLLHDHRTYGDSDGEPRCDIDPWQQIEDWRRAISFLEARPEVDERRVGLWGTSHAGGHAIVLGATDRRLRAVVAQVPIISGLEQARRRVAPDKVAALEETFDADERARFRGEPPHYQAVVSKDPAVPAAYYAPDAVEFYLRPVPEGGHWENTVTVRSVRKSRMYEPGLFITRVSPTPLLLVVAGHDVITPADIALAAYERALEPKRLELTRGGHFDAYDAQFDHASGAALSWFTQHLA
jgi:hypothetical protein